MNDFTVSWGILIFELEKMNQLATFCNMIHKVVMDLPANGSTPNRSKWQESYGPGQLPLPIRDFGRLASLMCREKIERESGSTQNI